jgi:hypothetical protein
MGDDQGSRVAHVGCGQRIHQPHHDERLRKCRSQQFLPAKRRPPIIAEGPELLSSGDSATLTTGPIGGCALKAIVAARTRASDRACMHGRLVCGGCQVKIHGSFHRARAERQLQASSQLVNPRHEFELEFFVVSMPGAAAKS